ncbi:MAG: hypothetical protein ACXW1A_02125 [Nitrososphaeraceae archaeon]
MKNKKILLQESLSLEQEFRFFTFTTSMDKLSEFLSSDDKFL